MTRRPRQPPPRPHALGRDQWTGTMSAPTTPRAELAAAVRAVNAAERRLPAIAASTWPRSGTKSLVFSKAVCLMAIETKLWPQSADGGTRFSPASRSP